MDGMNGMKIKKYFLVFSIFVCMCCKQIQADFLIDVVKQKEITINDAKEIIEKGVNLYRTDDEKRTALHILASKGEEILAKLLIDKFKNESKKEYINKQDEKERTPLHHALFSGHENVAKLLIYNGADTNLADENDMTPLHYAVGKVFLNIVKLLLEKGADINKKNTLNYTPLDLMIERSREDENEQNIVNIAKYLIDNKAQTSKFDVDDLINKKIAGDFYYEKYSSKLVGLLLQKSGKTGQQIKQLLFLDKTLMKIIKNLFRQVAKNEFKENFNKFENRFKKLIEKYDLNENKISFHIDDIKNVDGAPLLHIAAKDGIISNIGFLFSGRKANIESSDNEIRTPLMYAAWSGKKDNVDKLINLGANVGAVDANNADALFYAARSGSIVVVKYLIEKFKLSPAKVTKDGRNFLHFVAMGIFDKGIAEIALEKDYNVDINKQDNNGDTPLHEAVKNKNIEMIKWLCDYRVVKERYKTNNQGNSILHLAVLFDAEDVAKFLLYKNFDSNTRNDKTFETPLILAVRKLNPSMVQILLNYEAEISGIIATNVEGETPLMLVDWLYDRRESFSIENQKKIKEIRDMIYKKIRGWRGAVKRFWKRWQK